MSTSVRPKIAGWSKLRFMSELATVS